MLRRSIRPIAAALSALTLSQTKSRSVSCDKAKRPNDIIVANAAAISKGVYNSAKNLDEFHTVHIKNEIPSQGRSAHWAFYVPSGQERKSEEDKTLYLAFRGSDSTIDWIINSSFVPMKHPVYPDIKIHPGYYVEIDNDYDDLIHELKDKVKKNNSESIVVTGHSKGGAMCHVFVDRLLNDKNVDQSIKSNIQAVTFAAPMVYWFNDATNAKKILANDHIHNYVIRQDPVPFSPYFLKQNTSVAHKLIDKAVNDALYGLHYVASFVVDVTDTAKKQLHFVSKYVGNFKPIGSIYVSDVPDGSKQIFTFNKMSFGDFMKHADKTTAFNVKAHGMSNYIQVIDSSATVFKTRLESAKKGKKEDQNMIGLAYFNGVGTSKNLAEAESWFKKAALQGYSIAYYNIGDLEKEKGNFSKALEMYHTAANLGYKMSYFQLGFLYGMMAFKPAEHNLTDAAAKEYEKLALMWMTKSMEEANDVHGKAVIAVWLLNGIFAKQDIPKGRHLLLDASISGSRHADFCIGSYHENGEFGFEESLEKAIHYYVQAADKGSQKAQKRLDELRNSGL